MTFNPFKNLNCQFGAPMGRHGDAPSQYDGKSKLYARHGGGDGYYDRGGAYWGHGDIYAVYTRDGAFCCYIDGAFCGSANGVSSLERAIAKVRALASADVAT